MRLTIGQETDYLEVNQRHFAHFQHHLSADRFDSGLQLGKTIRFQPAN
jgi:hypothetical protein